MEVKGLKRVTNSDSSQDTLLCIQCKEDGKSRRTVAGYCRNCDKHLCQTCFDSHVKDKTNRDHVVFGTAHLPLLLSSSYRVPNDGCDVPCEKHSNKKIEFYCREHDCVVCYVCTNTEHKTCSMDYIPDISDKFAQRKPVVQTVFDIRQLLQVCQFVIEKSDENNQNISRSFDAIIADADQCRDSIIAAANQWHSVVTDEATAIRDMSCVQTGDVLSEANRVEKQLLETLSRYEQLSKNDENNQLFVYHMQTRNNHSESEAKLKDIVATDVADVLKMDKNTKIIAVLEQEKTLGTVRQISTVFPLYLPMRVKVSAPDDNRACRITGIALLSPNKVVLADYDNESIKILDFNHATAITDSMTLPSYPWDVTRISDDKCAVTCPSRKCIMLLSTEPKLSAIKTIKVSNRVYGISYANERLVVTYNTLQNTGTYEILTLNGKVVFSSSNLGLCPLPRYVASSHDARRVYISDAGNDRIVEVYQPDQKVHEYKAASLSAPSGIAVRSDDSLLVCSQDTDEIYKIDKYGNTTIVVNKDLGIKQPRAVCYQESTRLMFVSVTTDEEEHDNFITVIKLK